jgi:hypothetical protein
MASILSSEAMAHKVVSAKVSHFCPGFQRCAIRAAFSWTSVAPFRASALEADHSRREGELQPPAIILPRQINRP